MINNSNEQNAQTILGISDTGDKGLFSSLGWIARQLRWANNNLPQTTTQKTKTSKIVDELKDCLPNSDNSETLTQIDDPSLNKTIGNVLFDHKDDLSELPSLVKEYNTLSNITNKINGAYELAQRITRILFKVTKATIIALGVGAMILGLHTAVNGALIPSIFTLSSSIALVASAAVIVVPIAAVVLGVKILYNSVSSICQGAQKLLDNLCGITSLGEKAKNYATSLGEKGKNLVNTDNLKSLALFTSGVLGFAMLSPLRKIFIDTPNKIKDSLCEIMNLGKINTKTMQQNQ